MPPDKPDIPAPEHDHQLSTVDGLAQLSFLIQRALELRAAEHDLSLIQTRLLGVLRDRQPTMNELARLLDLDKSSVTGLVDRAERRGLVKRSPSTHDRRSVTVSLAPAARLLITQAAADFEADLEAMLSCLAPADQQRLASLITRVLLANAADRGLDLFATTIQPG
jgi:DNA-binding MarR family transcriptional regulator